MNCLGMLLGCVMGMSIVAVANEPVDQGARPSPPMRPGRGEMMEGGGEMMMILRPMVAKQLDLSSEQQSKIAAIVGSASNELSSLRANMQSLAQKQAELIGAETVDEAAVLKLADEIGKVRSELAKVQLKQMLAARKILTAEQRIKMRDLMKDFMEKREGKRPGARIPKGNNAPDGSLPPAPNVNAVSPKK